MQSRGLLAVLLLTCATGIAYRVLEWRARDATTHGMALVPAVAGPAVAARRAAAQQQQQPQPQPQQPQPAVPRPSWSAELRDPSTEAYNLSGAGPSWSQKGQDLKADVLLGGLEGGFFVEAGAYDGESASNTLYLERSKGWSGLLVEANPHLFARLLPKHRRCYAIHGGLSLSSRQERVRFRLAGPLGGYPATYSASHRARADGEIRAQEVWMAGAAGSGEDIDVPAYPLHDLLEEVERRRGGGGPLVVDFFSLDTEGSELGILETVDFDRVLFGALAVEYNGEAERERGLVSLMRDRKGFVLEAADGTDLWFTNPRYFAARRARV